MSAAPRITEEGRLTGVPFASFRASPHFDDRPEGAAGEVTLAVIHYISLPAGCFGGEAVDRLFAGTFGAWLDEAPDDPERRPLEELRGLRVSAHFFVRRTGEVIQYVDTVRRAWHAGLSNFRGRSACNDFSVGIELEGTGEVPFEDAQYASLEVLLKVLVRRHPIRAVTGHEFIAPGRKTDPGPHFDWRRLEAMLPEGVERATSPGDCDRAALAERMRALGLV